MLEDTLKKINVDLDILAEMLKEKENVLEKSEYKKCVEWIIEHKNTLISTKKDESIDNVLSGVLAMHIEKLIKLLEDNRDKCLQQIDVCKNDVNYFLSTIKSREENEKSNKNVIKNESLKTVIEKENDKKVEIIEDDSINIELSNLEDLIYYLQKIHSAYTEIKKQQFLEDDKNTTYLLGCYEKINNNYYDLIASLTSLEGIIDHKTYKEIQTNLDQKLRDFQNNLKNIYKSILSDNHMNLPLDIIAEYKNSINNEYYVTILEDKRVEKYIRNTLLRTSALNNFSSFLEELSYIIRDCENINNVYLYDYKKTDDVDVFDNSWDDTIQYLNNPIDSDDSIHRLNTLLDETDDFFESYNKEEGKKEEEEYSDVDYSSWFEDIKAAEDAINKEEQEAYDNNRLNWNKAREIQSKRKRVGDLSGDLSELDSFFKRGRKDKTPIKKFGLGSYFKALAEVKLNRKSPYDNLNLLPMQIGSYKKK